MNTVEFNKEFQDKEEVLMQKLINFYKEKNHLEIFKTIQEGTGRLSLRILDWFTTNYAKKHGTAFLVTNRKTGIRRHFNVYAEYKSQLDAYNKKYFDPFCRRGRIRVNLGNNEHITTTVGQLNFFRWVIDNNIIEYILDDEQDNLRKIEIDMNQCHKEHYAGSKERKKRGIRKKREQLVQKSMINICKF